MSQNPLPPDPDTLLQDAWDKVVGLANWHNSVILGEFADNRPLSAVVADMLISFVPGVVIVTSARDAVAVILRLARYPEKREELMEWVLLSACLIVIALPIAMAAAGAVGVGVGAAVGGIAGSELGAALRAVMLLLIKEASKLVDLVQFLQKFIKGDVLKFLRAVKFVQYENALLKAVNRIIGKLIEIVRALNTHLEGLKHFDTVKTTIARLAEWESRFYKVQKDALKQMPRALTELDARLAKILAQTTPKEVHTVAAGVQADKTAVALPAKQRIKDTPSKVLPVAEGKVSNASNIAKAKKNSASSKPKDKLKASSEAALNDKPDLVRPPDDGANSKRQAVADAAVTADRERITQLSREAREAEKSGNAVLANAKINEARDILRPYLPKKNSNGNWDEVVKRLDLSSPKDGAVFWSGTAHQAKMTGQQDAARIFAEKIGGVTLETTPGGRILDGWDEVNNEYPWNAGYGPPPWAGQLWEEASEKYAKDTSGVVNLLQTPNKLWDPTTIWHTREKPMLLDRLEQGKISEIKMHVIDLSSGAHRLPNTYINQLLKFDQRP